MHVRQIEVFRAIMLSGSISGAARLLHVSQPAVSQVIKHMEDQLRLKLFERRKGRLHATAEAQSLYAEVAVLYQHLQRVRDIASRLRKCSTGILRVVASPSITHAWMPAAIARFRKKFPGVEIVFDTLSFRSIVDSIVLGQADIAIVMCPEDEPALIKENLFSARLVCVVPKNHPLATRQVIGPADLAPFPLISFDNSNAIGRLIDQAYNEANEVRNVAIQVRFGVIAQELVSQGLGVAILDSLTATSAASERLVIRPFTPETILNVAIMMPEYRPPSALTIEFSGAVRDTVSAFLRRTKSKVITSEVPQFPVTTE